MSTLCPHNRAPLSLALTCALLAGAPAVLSGCDMFRTTRMGYGSGSTKDQVRQGEVVQVAVFKVRDPDTREVAPLVAASGVALASAALEKVVGFASDELQKHMEKIALLHEATYEGTAIVKDYNPMATYEVHIVRWVKTAPGNATPFACMRHIYLLEPQGLDNKTVAVIVRAVDKSELGDEKSELTRAAARLEKVDEPFGIDTTLSFFTAAANGESGAGGGAGAGSSKQPAQPKPAKDEAGKKPEQPKPADESNGKQPEQPNENMDRKQLGAPIKHSLLSPLGGSASVAEMKLLKKDSEGNVTSTTPSVGADALGFFVTDRSTPLLEIHLSVSEKDPSRAAERNREVQKNLKELTPQLIDYLKDRAGLKKEAAGSGQGGGT